MKFTKPINREVDIDGQHFIVSFDDISIEFRLKGKRKTARVEWSQVLDIARGEDGVDARALLGLGASTSAQPSGQEPARMAQNEDAMARTINPPAPAPQSQPDAAIYSNSLTQRILRRDALGSRPGDRSRRRAGSRRHGQRQRTRIINSW
jgi:hypothetical protein